MNELDFEFQYFGSIRSQFCCVDIGLCFIYTSHHKSHKYGYFPLHVRLKL